MTMLEETPENFNAYIERLFASEDDVLREARAEMEREGVPRINVSPTEGKMLHLLVLLTGARRILEIGTLGGYSAIWLARALPADGKLISLELDSHHAEVSRRNLERAGMANRVEVRVGPAAKTLTQMRQSGEAPFDVVFIDANKDGYPEYLDLVLPLTRMGGTILADNTLSGSILDPGSDSDIARYNAAVSSHPDLVSVILPVLRGSGLDGLLVSVKRG
jgi:predicted O-methyltransferase YrrM